MNVLNNTTRKTLTEVLQDSEKYLGISKETFKDAYKILFDNELNEKALNSETYVWLNDEILKSNYSMTPAGFYFKDEKKAVIIATLNSNSGNELRCLLEEEKFKSAFKNGESSIKKSQNFDIINHDAVLDFMKLFYDTSVTEMSQYEDAINLYYFN